MKKAANILFTLFLTVLFTTYLGERFTPNYIGDAFNQINTFHKMPENSFDVIVYGSSHAWRGCDVRELEKYGFRAYNYGCNWQAMNTTRLFVEDSLEKQSPQYVFIETYHPWALVDVNLEGQIYYTKPIRNSEAKWRYLRECFGSRYSNYLAYYFPIIAFHDNWSRLNQWNYENPTDDYDFEAYRGYMLSEEVRRIELQDYRQFAQEPLQPEGVKSLDAIVALCHAKGIDVIFYTVPFDGEYHYFDAFEQYAAENGCGYLNLFEVEGEYKLDPDTDFQDQEHLNLSGAQKVANCMGEYLLQLRE